MENEKRLESDEARSPAQLRAHLLSRGAALVDQYIDAAYGKDTIESIDPHFRQEVWGLIKKFIESADEKIYLPEDYRGSPEKVLEAVESGIITLEEGERLIAMYRVIEQARLPGADSLTQISIPSLNIHTLPAPGGDDGE